MEVLEVIKIIDLKEVFSTELLVLLKKIEIVSKKRGERVFLVGGIVRDSLLGIWSKDIDIVVEGDAINFSLELKKTIDAEKVITYEKFKTAVLVIDSKIKIDLASSRVEYYEYPASLPIVENSTIKEDMYRRDFTINSMALEIEGNFSSEVIDFYNGQEDLKNKKIKVLHNLSFIDDPTRIIRALRFAGRYKFDLEKKTEILLKDGISEGYLKKLSWPRLKQEFKILFDEKNSMRAICLLDKYNILEEIHPMIKCSEKTLEKIKKIEKVGKIFEIFKIEKWLIIFFILLENLEKNEFNQVLIKFDFTNKQIKKYNYGILKKTEILEKIKKIDLNSEIYIILNKISIETIVILMVESQNSDEESYRKIKKYLFEIKDVKPKIRGEDLIKKGIKPNKFFKSKLNYYFMLQLDNIHLKKIELLNF